MIKLDKELMSHIKEHFSKDHRELSIGLGRSDHKTLLGHRIMKKSKRLPHDHFLDKKYQIFRKLYWSLVSIHILGAIALIYIVVNY